MEEIPLELKNVAEFHGHLCDGLVLGYRIAILARKELKISRCKDEEHVVIVENDSCAVDAIQYINGATFGKGNLVFKDHGLHAYTFIDRNSGIQIRIERNADVFLEESEKRSEILQKINQNIPLTDEEKVLFQKATQELAKKLLKISDDELFTVKKVDIKVPETARIFNSLKCSKCGLMVMETKARVLNNTFFCIPCLERELTNE